MQSIAYHRTLFIESSEQLDPLHARALKILDQGSQSPPFVFASHTTSLTDPSRDKVQINQPCLWINCDSLQGSMNKSTSPYKKDK